MYGKCAGCGKSEKLELAWEGLGPPRGKTGHRSEVRIYANHLGHRWSGRFCYECAMGKIRKKRGTRPRSESLSPIIQKAYATECVAADYFRKFGCSVRHGHGAGPDLFINDGDGERSVEVKPATKTGTSWFIGKVKPARRNDDWIAIVMPNGKVLVQAMSDHLAACSPAGYRGITALVKIAGFV